MKKECHQKKERHQNPVIGDHLKLRLFSYNSNNRADLYVEKVDIFYIDGHERILIHTIEGEHVERVNVGQYLVHVHVHEPNYVIGNYHDVWTVHMPESDEALEITNQFEIIPSLWYTDTIPLVYNFEFKFMPNKIRKGSRTFLIIEIRPNVPHATDLEKYYTNLAIVSPFRIYIEQSDCMPCVPCESDLRMVIEGDEVELRERCAGYYLLDTEDMREGIYNVWFKLEMGESVYISPSQQLQIF